MLTQDNKAEIAVLERELTHYQLLLDKAFEANEELKKTKLIYHELKRISDELKELKNKKRFY
jgi:hypothetical protein